ncbi:ABC transporter permease [Streptomyces sp. RY43-2]|uniref:ABC transporter permease n=1 Tax=Streptomyces macrolidinus TaxID=2952607 RepID=A0ABT0ZLG3_9ACTN|nr:FtsX-like permease family protein [Streptomyces macrolidinus]MCN9244434.1 ABC transporter permease [Streptomyces macrolidinus]
MNVRQWARDLRMGARFAFTGGREGWIRVLLTAVGVGLGVALLLLTTAVPSVLSARDQRSDARADYPDRYGHEQPAKADDTLLIAKLDTTYHDQDIRGRLVQPDGPRATLAPGLTKYPAAGDMVVSPALKELLESGEGKLLRERIPYRVVGTIGESGLVGSRELAYYAGADDLDQHRDNWQVARLDGFGGTEQMSERMDPVLILLVVVVLVALLMPVAVFIAAAVRFGGERRDRRLAALRLVGSDSRMTHRIAAGEALAGALLGLVFGTVFFLIGRQAVGSVEIQGISVFPGDLNPTPVLAACVALAVPAAAVLVTLFALRGVVIEPLGVVRTAKPARRRLWWRLLLPLVGLAMLYPMFGQGRDNGDFNKLLVIGGVLLLLAGVTALLPWFVEAVVGRLGGGGVAWQLAVRRLQLSSGSAARSVNGIAVAVAGAIALQMFFAGIESDYTSQTRYDLDRAQMSVTIPAGTPLAPVTEKFAAVKGVRKVTALGVGSAGDKSWRTGEGPDNMAQIAIGDCAALRDVAALPSCHDGDVFALDVSWNDEDTKALAKPGRTLHLGDSEVSGKALDVKWTVPQGLRHARAVKDANGMERGGFLMTPSALPAQAVRAISGEFYLSLDESVPDVKERVRNAALAADPFANMTVWTSSEESTKFVAVRKGLLVGATCVLLLIGASLLVSQLEQLRERKKLLSALVAFGTRRRTLSLSVLWQTAVPVALGLLLASVVGLTLGMVLLKMSRTPLSVHWSSVLSMAGIGAGVVLLVTLLSLPPLLRLMRPDGLRTE